MSVSVPPGKQTFFDPETGTLLGLGTVTHYIPTTTSPKNTWADEAMTQVNPNPITLDATGSCSIWGNGLYRQIVRDSAGNLIWDRITGFGDSVPSNASPVTLLANIAALRAYTASANNGAPVYLAGYTSALDGGQGFFIYYSSSAVADNGGTIIVDGLGRRWCRSYSGPLLVQWFGAKLDGATDDTAAVTACKAAAGVGGIFSIDHGTAITTGLSLNVAGQTLIIPQGAVLKGKAAINGNVITIAAAGVTVTGGGEVNGNRAAATASRGISNSAFADLTIDGVRVTACKGYGIYGRDAQRQTVQNTRVTDTSSIAIFHETLGSASVDGLKYINNEVDRFAEGSGIAEGGLKVRGSSSHLATNAIFEGNRAIMPLNPSDSSAIGLEYWYLSNAQIMGEVSYGGNMGLSLDTVLDSSVTGGALSGFKNFGLELPACQRVAVSGMKITGGVNGVSISNTTPIGNSLTGLNISGCSGSAIKAQGADGLTISGGRITVTSASYGIEIISTVDYAVAGVTLTGAGTGTKGIMLDTSPDGAVSGCNISNFTQNGVLIFATTAVVVDWITIAGNTFRSVNAEVATQFSGGATGGSHIRLTGNNRVQPGSSLLADWRNFVGNVSDITGSGSPETVYTAAVGSTYLRTDGGAATTLYIKESGTGNVGWIAK